MWMYSSNPFLVEKSLKTLITVLKLPPDSIPRRLVMAWLNAVSYQPLPRLNLHHECDRDLSSKINERRRESSCGSFSQPNIHLYLPRDNYNDTLTFCILNVALLMDPSQFKIITFMVQHFISRCTLWYNFWQISLLKQLLKINNFNIKYNIIELYNWKIIFKEIDQLIILHVKLWQYYI